MLKFDDNQVLLSTMHPVSITTFYLFTPLPEEEIARLEKRFHLFLNQMKTIT